MKAFIFRSAVKSVRYEVFETIINMMSPIYRQIVFIFYIQGVKMYFSFGFNICLCQLCGDVPRR